MTRRGFIRALGVGGLTAAIDPEVLLRGPLLFTPKTHFLPPAGGWRTAPTRFVRGDATWAPHAFDPFALGFGEFRVEIVDIDRAQHMQDAARYMAEEIDRELLTRCGAAGFARSFHLTRDEAVRRYPGLVIPTS